MTIVNQHIVYAECKRFIREWKIKYTEEVYLPERVVATQEFVERLCNIIGYYQEPNN